MGLSTSGSYKHLETFLTKNQKLSTVDILQPFGQDGVEALANTTPVDTGNTSASWYYEIEEGKGYAIIHWCNSHVNEGVNIAVILQYGHGTGTGAYVEGVDYINPALRPIFDKIADEAWKKIINT